MLDSALREITDEGGRAFYVGGFVRDQFLGIENKDIDIEVYRLTYKQLCGALSRIGCIDTVGQSFGVVRIKGLDVDFSLPRSESKSGQGHRGFIVNADPFLTFEAACRRRDLTINAMMQDVLNGDVLDFFGGQNDLTKEIVRHIDDATFADDPLRVYRVAQFAGRLNFTVAPQTLTLCSQMDVSSLTRERVFEELSKLLLKAKKPSVGLHYLEKMGVLETRHPFLFQMIGCPQSAKWHPEGDVWQHTLLTVDEAAKLRPLAKEPEHFMFGALCHDIGKPVVTRIVDGKLTSVGHDSEAGIERAIAFMHSLTDEKRLVDAVAFFTRTHMQPNLFYSQGASDAAIRRLIAKSGDRFSDLLLLAEADHRGRLNAEPYSVRAWFDQRIADMNLPQKIEPLVKGRDLLALGMKQGPALGKVLRTAFDMQLEGMSHEVIIEEVKRLVNQ